MNEQKIAEFVGLMHIKHITQKQLSQKMNVSENYVSEVLRGKKRISPTNTTFTDALNELIAEQHNKTG